MGAIGFMGPIGFIGAIGFIGFMGSIFAVISCCIALLLRALRDLVGDA